MKGNFFKIIFRGREKEYPNLYPPKNKTVNLKQLGLNDRQIAALEKMTNKGDIYTIKSYMNQFNVSRATASRDLNYMIKEGLIYDDKYVHKRNKSIKGFGIRKLD